jgi:hypothetical protein
MSVSVIGSGIATFPARNGAGAISVPGLKVGDIVLWSAVVTGETTTYEPPGGVWEIVVTVDDQIQQKDPSDLSACTARVVFLRSP